MIVVSNGKSVKVNGYLARTEEQLHHAGIETVLYDKIEANPLRQTVTAGGQMAAASGADFLVALGGGSVIDASKGIAVVAANGGDVWDYITNGTGKGMPIEKHRFPLSPLRQQPVRDRKLTWAASLPIRKRKKNAYQRAPAFPAARYYRPGTHGIRTTPFYSLSGIRCLVPQH